MPLNPLSASSNSSGTAASHATLPLPPLLSIVICTLDEHESIARVLAELDATLPQGYHEILVVDDSPDERTADVVRTCAHTNPRIRLLHRRGTNGLSAAAIAGWDQANGRYLAIMDGDGQHDPRLIGGMLAAIRREPLDLVVASRYLDGDDSGLGRLRHTLSRGGTWLTDRMLGIALADPLSGCFMMTREWYAEVRPQLSGLGFKILVDIVASAARRPRVAQLPTLLRARLGGASKLSMRVALDLILLLLEKRSHGRLSARGLMLAGIAIVALLIWLTTTDLAIRWGSTVPLALILALLIALGCADWIARRLKFKFLRRS